MGYSFLKNSAISVTKLFVAILSSVNSTVASADGPLPTDSLHMSKELREVVISAPQAIVMSDKTIFIPTEELKKTAPGCVQLLAGLQIPQLIVNPATGSVSMSGGERLGIRINGRPATQSELASIPSKNITRIDYISDPGPRYGDFDAVIDIYVKRSDSGYGAMFNLLQSPNRGWGNYAGSLNYSAGNSEWAVSYNSNPMWDMDCHRDNAERIVEADGNVITRNESGIDVPNRMVTHNASLQYSYSPDNWMLFNVQTRLLRQNDHYASHGDILTETNGSVSSTFETETNLRKSWQGELDIYFHYRINSRSRIYLNLVPAISKGTDTRTYFTPDLSIHSNIDNTGVYLLAEGIWETRVGGGTISSGIRAQSSWSKAKYLTGDDFTRDTGTDTYFFAEWKQSRERFQYSASLGATLRNVNHPVRYDAIFFNPRFRFRYSPFDWGAATLSLNVRTVSPTINQLNPILQRVDGFQWSEGNPALSSFQQYESRLEFDFNSGNIFAKFIFNDTYSRSPVMGAKNYFSDGILQSYFNAGYNHGFEVRASIRMPLFVTQLTLSLEGGWHHTVSMGIDYRHRYSQPFVNAQLMFMKGSWWIMAKYNNTYNSLWGEMISTINPNLMNFGVGYTWRHATFMAGIVNPFGNVALRTRDLSRLASYDRTYQASGSHRLVWVGVTLNLHKGKSRPKLIKKLENSTKYESINNRMK